MKASRVALIAVGVVAVAAVARRWFRPGDVYVPDLPPTSPPPIPQTGKNIVG